MVTGAERFLPLVEYPSGVFFIQSETTDSVSAEAANDPANYSCGASDVNNTAFATVSPRTGDIGFDKPVQQLRPPNDRPTVALQDTGRQKEDLGALILL